MSATIALRAALNPLSLTSFALLCAAATLAILPGFHPAEEIFIIIAAALEFPCAFWAREVERELALSRWHALGLLLLAWCLPPAFYGLFAGPAWIVIGSHDGDVRFAIAGVALLLFACVVGVGLHLIENHRRDQHQVSEVSPA